MTDSPSQPETTLEKLEKPAALALLTGLALRVGHTVLGRASGDDAPGDAQSGKAVQTLAALAIARMGTKSLRGATLVSAGLIAKALFDRSQKRRAGQHGGKPEA